MTIIILFAALMLAGAVSIITKSGEKDGICKYGYKEDESGGKK